MARSGGVPKWLREGSAKPPFTGSSPVAASISPSKSLKINDVTGPVFGGVLCRL